MPVLSVEVPDVKLVLAFLTVTETPSSGSLELPCTIPFTLLDFSWAKRQEDFNKNKKKRKTTGKQFPLKTFRFIYHDLIVKQSDIQSVNGRIPLLQPKNNCGLMDCSHSFFARLEEDPRSRDCAGAESRGNSKPLI